MNAGEAVPYVLPLSLRGRIGIQGRVAGHDFRALRPVLRDETGQPFDLDCRIAPAGHFLANDRGACYLLAFLDGAEGPEAAFAARAIRRLVGFPDALALVDGRGAWGHQDLGFYASRTHLSERRALAREWPGFTLLLARSASGLWNAGGSPVDTLARDLRSAYPACRFEDADLVRIGKGAVQPGNLSTLAALLTIPRDWVPRTPAAILDFMALALATRPLARSLGGYGFLLSSKGRWDTFGEQVRRWAELGLDGTKGWTEVAMTVLDSLDMARAFQRQALFPSMASQNPEEHDIVCDRVAYEEGVQSVPWCGARVLFSGKGLPAILELSASWHRHSERVDDAVLGHLGEAAHSWPVPFETRTAPNGVVIEFLSSRAKLRAEGAKGSLDGSPGLEHCVATHTQAAMTGSHAIASLGIHTPEGFRRLSTVEMDADFSGGDVEVVQHKGFRNGAPPAAARTALGWFVRQVEDRKILPIPSFLPAHRRPGTHRDPIGHAAGYDVMAPGLVDSAVAAWSPYLPRPLRSPAALAAHPAAHEMKYGPVQASERRFGLTFWPDLNEPDGRLVRRTTNYDGPAVEHDPDCRVNGFASVLAWPCSVAFRSALLAMNRIASRRGMVPCTGVTGTVVSTLATRTRRPPASTLLVMVLALLAAVASVAVDSVIAYAIGGVAGAVGFALTVTLACLVLAYDRGCGPDRISELARLMAGRPEPAPSLIEPEPRRDDQRVPVR